MTVSTPAATPRKRSAKAPHTPPNRPTQADSGVRTGARRPDPALLHALARRTLMQLVLTEPGVVEAYASVLAIDGPNAGALIGDADTMLDALAAGFAARLPWSWLRYELERAFSAFAWHARIQRRVPPAGEWFNADAIVADALTPAPLAVAPALPPALAIEPGDTLSAALDAAWTQYIRSVQAIRAVAPSPGPPTRRASADEQAAVVDAVPVWWAVRFMGVKVTEQARAAYPDNFEERGSSVRHAIERVDELLAEPPANRLLAAAPAIAAARRTASSGTRLTGHAETKPSVVLPEISAAAKDRDMQPKPTQPSAKAALMELGAE
jgi:hypothetical protein